MKQCKICGTEKAESEFYAHRETRDHLFPYCKACHIAKSSEAKRKRKVPSEWALRRADRQRRGVWWCRKCEQEKPEGEFLVVAGQRTSPCRACANAQQMADYVPHPKVRGAHLDLVKFRAKKKRRRARERGAEISDFTGEQWEAVKAAYGYRCAYCGTGTVALTQDHVIPLAKGGHHTATNIVPACKTCNSRKGANDWSDRLMPLE